MPVNASPDPKIEVIQSAGSDPYLHFAWRRLRSGKLTPLQDLGPAMARNSECLHGKVILPIFSGLRCPVTIEEFALSTRTRTVSLALAVCWAGLTMGTAGLGAQPAGEAEDSSPYLIPLPSATVPVRYLPGSLSRAAQVQARLAPLVEDFAKASRSRIPVTVSLLSREEWDSGGWRQPFGFAAQARDGVALAAWGDTGTVSFWRQLLGGGLPMGPAAPLRGTPEEAASLEATDRLAAVESARYLVRRSGYYGDEPWVEEVVAHLLLLENIERYAPATVPAIEAFWTLLSRRGQLLGKKSLKSYVGVLSPREWLGFQAQFHRGAGVLSKAGISTKDVYKAARKQGGAIQAAWLLKRHPGLKVWLANAFRQG